MMLQRPIESTGVIGNFGCPDFKPTHYPTAEVLGQLLLLESEGEFFPFGEEGGALGAEGF
jgi:hypothetical protein